MTVGRSQPRGRGSRIGAAFSNCRKLKRSAFIPYLCAGDPDLQKTPELLRALAGGGAGLIELGVPFSDPMADGPTNQRASHRALEAGTTLSGILEMVALHREELGVPIVLFTYCNPIFQHGLARFAEQASASGVDGVLFVDLPPEEAAEEVTPTLAEHGIDKIFLLAPTSTRGRIRSISQASSGFVYYVSRTGVTGEQDQLAEELLEELRAVRRRVRLPLAVGFGISTPEQVGTVAEVADAVVVGSHLVRMVEEHAGDVDLASLLEDRVRELMAPLSPQARRARP